MRKRTKFYVFLGCLLVFIPLTLSAGDYKYVASKFSIKYHLPTCKQVRGLQEQNRVGFNTAEEAVKAGYVPCGVCKPPTSDN
jgi:methylphosphotriester-DNA--protein-cysteine methyltransferase